MPKRSDLRKILIIGAGPIIIGQACEFDYSGSQACRALLSEGYEVVLINSNPATIMTDPELATRTYIEPITPAVVARIIEVERPDALLPTMGGQTALNVAFALHADGTLKRHNVELIGANIEAITLAEDRQAFKQMIIKMGLDMLRSATATSVAEALPIAAELGYPLILRTAFTLGGSGGGVVYTQSELQTAVEAAIASSPIKQVLLEESALGWKEYEYEVMRDKKDNVVIVSSVENLDPMGIHTGDSITVAPAQTLSDKEYHTLRNASIAIIRQVGVDAGGCNIQFAVHPKTGRVVVIEMNPRVSRSSALVSKATGVPIAKISAKLAVGLTLDEITNDITQSTPACFEPALDYVVTKIPRFAFEKFPGSVVELSPQMHSVGEVMAIGRTFQESFQKALRGLEIGLNGFGFPLVKLDPVQLRHKLSKPGPDRIRWVYQALHSGIGLDELYQLTHIDPWFLRNIADILKLERQLGLYTIAQLPDWLLTQAKQAGFSDVQLSKALAGSPTPLKLVTAKRQQQGLKAVFKAVDTCAGEFSAKTPYYYSTYDAENELEPNLTPSPSPQEERGEMNTAHLPSSPLLERRGAGGEVASAKKGSVMILGGGPNRIGQGIEFDYCCVHAAFQLQKMGYEAVMVNCNPETVSTDYDISDRLYFEPLTTEDVLAIVEQEQALTGGKLLGVMAQFGGQTPLKLAKALEKAGVTVLGTNATNIDLAEDREKFSQLLSTLGLRSPQSGIARTELEALGIARSIGYPLIARPSFVLGGTAMRIFYAERSLRAYLSDIIKVEPEHPVLIERFLEEAKEYDVDAVSDGETTFIGGILEHVEHAGIHSGDSSCVWPPQTLSPALEADMRLATAALAKALQVKGLLNIQFAEKDGELYVLEVNPRASRTVPFVCKSTMMPLLPMAIRVLMGETLAEIVESPLPKGEGVTSEWVSVKVPVFPFAKFKGADPKLGPEMRSTGEVMGLDKNFALAFAKAQMGAGMVFPQAGGNVFISVNNNDKPEALALAKRFTALGFGLMATPGTVKFLADNGLVAKVVYKKTGLKTNGGDDDEITSPNAQELIEQGQIHLVINTPQGEEALRDDSYIRKSAVRYNIPMATTLSGGSALLDAIEALRDQPLQVYSLQDMLAKNTVALV
jgi:carbamoyl-phosphate synthase large subunit